MATVFVWENDKQTGHASLYVGDQYNNRYLSYHPDDIPHFQHWTEYFEFITTNYNPRNSSLDADLNNYNYSMADDIYINAIDDDAMMEFIDELFDPEMGHHYNIVLENCSTAVGICLMKGVARKAHELGLAERLRYEYESSGLARALAHYGRGSHSHIAESLFEEIPEHLARPFGNQTVRRVALSLAALTKTFRHVIWTPDDVQRFAVYLRGLER